MIRHGSPSGVCDNRMNAPEPAAHIVSDGNGAIKRVAFLVQIHGCSSAPSVSVFQWKEQGRSLQLWALMKVTRRYFPSQVQTRNLGEMSWKCV
jgi:hypothetical protein